MRVLVVSPSFRPIGGTELYARSLVAAAADLGHSVVVVGGEDPAPEVKGATRAYALPDLFVASLRPDRLRRSWAADRAWRRLLDRERPDVASQHLFDSPLPVSTLQGRVPTLRFVHTAWPYCPAGTRWLPRSNQACRIRPGWRCLRVHAAERCLVTQDGRTYSLKDRFRRILDLRLQGRYLRGASVVVANSDYTAGELQTVHGPLPRVAVLPPPISPSTAEERDPLPHRLLVVGRLVPSKGIEDAIEVARRLPHTELIVVGDGPLRSDLQRLVAAHQLDGRVRFRGWLSRPEIDAEMRAASVVLFPSHWPEPFGQVGVQAALNARPVVAYHGGGVPTWALPETAVLVPPGDVDALAAAAADLVTDPSLAATMGDAAVRAASRFLPRAFAQRLEGILHEAVAHPPPRADARR